MRLNQILSSKTFYFCKAQSMSVQILAQIPKAELPLQIFDWMQKDWWFYRSWFAYHGITGAMANIPNSHGHLAAVTAEG